MRKLLFHRGQVLVAAGAATLALAACGGGSDDTDAGAPAAQAIAQESSAAADERTLEGPLAAGDVLAADAGAASQEPL